jgi:putative acyl-CoA dehydrogenase
MSVDAEAHPPELVHFDPWGRRIDHLQIAAGWQALHGVAATEGIVATAYERQYSVWSRLHQFVRLYLFHPSSAMVSCPLAMTDGAARVLEQHADDDLKRKAFTRLTSRDPKRFWTSGQWMTERTGGSDVSSTSTEARWVEGEYRLYGTKWFTSATTSQMALALAKTEHSDKLSLYYLETRDEKGLLNQIEIHRLKDKLGTRAMPTAELSLRGTPAQLLGAKGEGVKTVATGFLSNTVEQVRNALGQLIEYRRHGEEVGIYWQQAGARQFAFALAQIYIASLLLEQAQWSCGQLDSSVVQRMMAAAKRWSAHTMGTAQVLNRNSL